MVGKRGSAVGALSVAILALLLGIATPVAQAATAPATTVAASVSLLTAGQTIPAGSQRVSANKKYRLTMQADGNLRLSGEHDRTLWVSGTAGHPGARAQLRTSGDLAVIDKSNRVLWRSNTGAARSVVIENDGIMTLYDRSWRPLWRSVGSTSVLAPGYILRADEKLIAPTGEFLRMGATGNLIVWRGKTPLWQTGTKSPGAFARVDLNGNLAVYDAHSRMLWSAGATDTGPTRLVAGKGGVVALTGSYGTLWTTATPQPTPRELANRLLSRWGRSITGLPGVRADLLAVSRGQTIRNADSCNRAVTVHPDVLSVLYRVSNRYTLKINNIITGHGCDTGQHPNGRAFDLNLAVDRVTGRSTNFASYTGGDNAALDRELMVTMAKMLRTNVKAGLGQNRCPGRQVTLPAGVEFFPDSCTHQHVTVAKW